MNRLVRGSVILAAAAVSWACGGLDTDGADETAELVADPSVVYVTNTDSQAVFVEALNELGQQLEGDFAVESVGPGLIAFIDTTFAPIPSLEGNPTRVRLFVKPADPTSFVSSSVTVTANGKSLVIPVSVTPANVPGTFSAPTPNVGDTVSFTAAAPIRFSATSTIAFGSTPGIITGFSADSTTVFFLPPPGASGAATFEGLRLPYLNIGLSAATISEVAVQNVTSLTGTDDPATAPVLPAPPQGATTSFFDLGSFTGADITGDGGVGAQYYQMTLVQSDTLDITLEFGTTGDLDLVICSDVACNTANYAGATGSHPEHVTLAFVAGTYYFAVVNFDGGSYASFRMDIENP